MVFLSGALLGLSLATIFGIGPAFFTLIQTSINRGFKRALFFDAGVMLSDVAAVVVMLMTSVQLDFNSGNRNVVLAGIAAGIIVIVFGIFTYRSEPEKVVERSKRKNEELEQFEKKFEKLDEKLDKVDERLNIRKPEGSRWYVYLGKGFAMNVLNPFIWIFWMTCVATASGSYDGELDKVIMFFLGTFATVFTFDILKIMGAYSLKHFFTEERMRMLNHATGIILIICGLVVIGRVLFL